MKKLVVLLCTLLALGSRAQALEVSAPSALLMEKETGTVLFAKDEHAKLEPASVTKVMTLLLTMEAIDAGQLHYDDVVTASAHACSMGGSQIWLKENEQMTVSDMLKAVCVVSANDCAVALAETVAGSEEAFVALMNRKAGELGMKHTHFANCTGLTSPEHYSSAADLAVLLQAALNNETFRTVFTTGQYTSSVTAQHPKGLYMASTLLSRLDGGEVTGGQILGGKTGYTDAAGLCLASLAVVNGKEYILVTLGAPGNHATEQTNIMDAVQVYRRLEKKK
mgnify:CR=1 FL=1